ncbi:MAG: hypothetical protein COA36_12580 [Desulfotalea sp.]|nr:MAG: hypothetical protein COA36_12580 [Desulfotalea sp.]
MSHYQQESTDSGTVLPIIEDKNRRRVVKGIVCGLTAFTAYNVLPSKWGTPIIEQVFLPAHAATSGAILSGNFSGAGSTVLASMGVRQSPNGFIAKVGTSIGDLFVSEVHAAEIEEGRFGLVCCIRIEGENITYYPDFSEGGCLSFSGLVDGVATFVDRVDDEFTGEIIEKGQDNVSIRVTRKDWEGVHSATLDLSRSEKLCKCPEHIDE